MLSGYLSWCLRAWARRTKYWGNSFRGMGEVGREDTVSADILRVLGERCSEKNDSQPNVPENVKNNMSVLLCYPRSGAASD